MKTFYGKTFTVSLEWLEAYGEPHMFEAVDLGTDWNGWGCPGFDKETAAKVAEAINNTYKKEGSMERIVFEGDRYTCYGLDERLYYAPSYYIDPETETDNGPWVILEEFPKVEVNGSIVYPIGAGGWIWHIKGWKDEEDSRA